MKWTAEKPTKEGYYWRRRARGTAGVVYVWRNSYGMWRWAFPGHETDQPIHNSDPEMLEEWAGPLSEPE